MCSIKPLGYRVLVKPEQGLLGGKVNSLGERVSKHGIVLPEMEAKREEAAQVYGTIVAIGALAWKDKGDGEAWCQVGDYVSYAKYGGMLMNDPVTKERFIVLQDLDIISVLPKPTTTETGV